MRDFLSIQLEEVSGEPPLAMFTVTSNIEGVQSALSSGWETASGRSTIPLLLRLLEMQSSQDPRHPALSITDDGRVSYREPVCPGCGSREHKLNGTQARTLQCFFGMALDMRLQKYVCKACGKAYKVELGHIVPRHGHYTRDVRGLAIGYTGGRALSLEESVELTHQVSGVRPSRETVRLWKLSAGRRIRKEMSERQAEWSGVYSYDEQYVRIGGERKYRCLVYDSGRKEPVGEMIVADLDKRTLKRFLGRVLRGKPVLTMVTDGMEQYPELLREMFPEASHQVCVIHTMYNAKMDLKEAAGLGKESSKPLPEGLAALYGALWDVFLHSDSVEEAEEKYQAIYARRFDYHPKVVHRLELMAEKLPRLTEYLAHPDVPMTNNPAEAYFHRTHPERIKKRFRTKDGLEAQVMCLEAGQVDGISGEGDTQETLRRIYETFAKLMVNV
jgi:transposase-like protein